MKLSLSRLLKISLVFTIAALFLTGCDKNTVVPFNPKKKLLYKEVYDNQDTLYFSYDSKQRLIQMVGNDMNGIYKYFKFTYDDNNRLVEAANEIYGAGTATFTFKYFLPDSAKVTFQQVGAFPQVWLLSFNKKGQLIKNDMGYNARQSGLNIVSYTTYDYDTEGNVITYDQTHYAAIPQIDTYTYDDKKSPFNNVVGLSPLFSLIFNDYEHGYPDTFLHNRIHISFSTAATAPGDVYTYQYDSEGYPVSGVFNANGVGHLTIQYFYRYSD